jgi:hypothetical protein
MGKNSSCRRNKQLIKQITYGLMFANDKPITCDLMLAHWQRGAAGQGAGGEVEVSSAVILFS